MVWRRGRCVLQRAIEAGLSETARRACGPRAARLPMGGALVRLGRQINELPLLITVLAGEAQIVAVEAALLHGLAGRLAVDAHDAAVGRLDDPPVGRTGQRVRVQAP